MAWLVALTADQQKTIVTALGAASPSARVSQLAQEISAATDLPIGDVSPALTEIAKIYALRIREDTGLGEFVDMLIAALLRTEIIDDADDPALRGFLAEVLSQEDSLGVAARAMSIVRAGTRLFCNARVLTDLRPVFPADAKTGPTAAVIAHSLEITFHDAANWRRESTCITMRTKDLRRLRDAIDRAIDKEASLTDFVKSTNLPVLEIEE